MNEPQPIETYVVEADGKMRVESPAPASCSEATLPNQHIYTESDAEVIAMKWVKDAGGVNGNRTITRKSSGLWFADDDWLGIHVWARSIEELAGNLSPQNAETERPEVRS